MGNARWPNFSEVRARADAPISIQNGVEVVTANGNGFSASDKITTVMQQPGKKVWRIKKGAALPPELVLVKDLRPKHQGHYMIAPAKTMPLKKYLGALRSSEWIRAAFNSLSWGAIQMAVKFIVSEYNILWKALKHYEKHLQDVSATTTDEDEQLFVDEDLMKMEAMFQDIQEAAKKDWGLDLK